MKSCFVPLCPTQDVDHPFVQHIHTVYGTHTSSIEKKKNNPQYIQNRIQYYHSFGNPQWVLELIPDRLRGATTFEWGEDNGKIGTMATLLSLELQKPGERSLSRSKLS